MLSFIPISDTDKDMEVIEQTENKPQSQIWEMFQTLFQSGVDLLVFVIIGLGYFFVQKFKREIHRILMVCYSSDSYWFLFYRCNFSETFAADFF